MSDERQVSPRPRLQAVAALETSDRHANDQAFSAVSDISPTGIGIDTGQPPLKGQRVRIRLAIEEQIHTVTAVATRVERRSPTTFHVHLDWSLCSDDELGFLNRYLAAVESDSQTDVPSDVPADDQTGVPADRES